MITWLHELLTLISHINMIAYHYVIVNKTLNFLVTDARDTMVLLCEHQFLRYIFEIIIYEGTLW